MSSCSWDTQPRSRFNVFNGGHSHGKSAASSARRTVDKSVPEEIQDNRAVETGRALAELEAGVVAQVKAAAKTSAKPKVDVQGKRKAFAWRKDGDVDDDGEEHVEDKDEDDDDE